MLSKVKGDEQICTIFFNFIRLALKTLILQHQ